MALIPLLFGGVPARRHRHNHNHYGGGWDDDLAMMPYGGYGGYSNYYDPFNDVNSALSEMANAMNYVNREMGRLSGGGMNMNQLMSGVVPDVVEENGQKKIQYSFDVRGFKPEDIKLKTQDGRLVVSAKHEEGGDDHRVVREFHRMVAIPEGVNVEDLKSKLINQGRNGGVLRVEAPYNPPALENKQEQGKEIPITHETSQSGNQLAGGDNKQQGQQAGKK